MSEKELEKILKALANRRRLAILKYLKHKNEAAVNEIARIINVSLKSTSKHLRILLAIDAIEREQRSLSMFYSLTLKQSPVVSYLLSRL